MSFTFPGSFIGEVKAVNGYLPPLRDLNVPNDPDPATVDD